MCPKLLKIDFCKAVEPVHSPFLGKELPVQLVLDFQTYMQLCIMSAIKTTKSAMLL